MTEIIVGFLSGLIGAMGLGGGTVLLIYLAAFSGMEQLRAAGVNLLFFIPIATLSVVIYAIKKQIHWKTVAIFALSGLVGAVAGFFLSAAVGDKWARLAFAALLIVLGVKSLFTRKRT